MSLEKRREEFDITNWQKVYNHDTDERLKQGARCDKIHGLEATTIVKTKRK